MPAKILKKDKELQYAEFDGEIIAIAPEIPAYFVFPESFRAVWDAIDGESGRESIKEKAALEAEEFDSVIAKLLDAGIVKEGENDA